MPFNNFQLLAVSQLIDVFGMLTSDSILWRFGTLDEDISTAKMLARTSIAQKLSFLRTSHRRMTRNKDRNISSEIHEFRT